MRRQVVTSSLVVWPLPLWAHEAFGDLGPFYQALLHPVVDPLQGLIVVGAAVFLARQPLPAVRLAFPTFVLAALAAVLAAPMLPNIAVGQRGLALIAAFAGLMAAVGLRPGPVPSAVIASALGLAAGSLVDPVQYLRVWTQTVAGAALGLAIVALLVWGIAERADRRVSPVAGAVVGGWVAAIGLMVSALPA